MSNSVAQDKMAHDEPSDLDLCCLQKPIIIACGSERVNPQWFELPMSRINFHGPKDVRVIEVLLYSDTTTPYHTLLKH